MLLIEPCMYSLACSQKQILGLVRECNFRAINDVHVTKWLANLRNFSALRELKLCFGRDDVVSSPAVKNKGWNLTSIVTPRLNEMYV